MLPRLRPHLSSSILTPLRRCYATPAVTVTSTRNNASAPLLANIEASWKDLPKDEQYQVYQQLGEIQKRDWKELSIDEKKAGEPARDEADDWELKLTLHFSAYF